MSRATDNDAKTDDAQTHRLDALVSVLARWACEMNCFDWPADFLVGPPKGWNQMTDSEKMNSPKGMLIYKILRKITPRKEVARFWHTSGRYGLIKTIHEFEKWWRLHKNDWRFRKMVETAQE